MSFQSFIDLIISGTDREIAIKFKIKYLEMRDIYGWRPLHYASFYGRVDLVKILIVNKCDINALGYWRYQPIHLACENGHIDIVKILIANKCNINASSLGGYQPIHLACENGHIDIVKILIANKCNINASSLRGYQPIHSACHYGHIDIVKTLIKNKCDINASHKIWGYQPIHWACENGHIDIVKILIKKKCDINASVCLGNKPIHFACENGHIDIVKILIENKCDINASDKWGFQPINLAYEKGHIDIVKVLIENKCDVNAHSEDGNKPIHFACENGHIDVLKILIENKCDINASNEDGNKPIHLACENGHIDIVKILIENKCDINAYDEFYGNKPINLAYENGHIDIVKILIENKCDINASSEWGYQPIHWACENGHIDIVKIFIDNNCDMKALTKDGKSLIDIAKQRGYQEIIDIISPPDPIKSIITEMNLNCTINCNHKFCRKTLKLKKMPKGKFLGEGSFGKVYKYKISNRNREIVIKKIKYIPEEKRNIESNINKYSPQIIHRNIVRYFGALEKSGKFCIFMEYISGGSLKDLIDKVGIIEINKVIQYSKQILVGLQFLHCKSIIHRDIKPGNILLDLDETVKLTDFGISLSFTKTMNKAESCYGTPNYRAPEVFLDNSYDYSVDIWSTGATIIHLITGKMPYHNLRAEAVLFKIKTEKKIEFTPLQPISDTMQSFINDLLIPDQSNRPSAKVLLNHSIFDNLR